MAIQLTLHRYFWIVSLMFVVACGQQAAARPPETPIPTVVSPTLVPTSTLIPVTDIPTPLPTPLPTQPMIPMITPDAIQVERWEEYEDALARSLFRSSFISGEFLCEWEILGRTDQEVYVWAVCMSIFPVIFSSEGNGLPYHGEIPAVIHIGVDGTVQRVEIPGGGSDYAADIRRMFPPEAQEKYFDRLINFQELTDHLNWRREHPEEPPLIVLIATPRP